MMCGFFRKRKAFNGSLSRSAISSMHRATSCEVQQTQLITLLKNRLKA